MGVARNIEQAYRWTSSAFFTTSSGFGYVTARRPSMIGNQSVTVQPKLWKNGSDASTPSPGLEIYHQR